ncbi:MAG: hypothetical protein NVS2B14_12940 [Chamaesiphon sp.]
MNCPYIKSHIVVSLRSSLKRLVLQFTVVPDKHPAIFVGLAVYLLVSLSACANSSTSQALERSFAPDSRLKDNPVTFGQSAQNPLQKQKLTKLPVDFPAEIPLYPEAQLQEVSSATMPDSQAQQTRWTTTDLSNLVQSFYQKAFQSNGWQIVSQPDHNIDDTWVARRNNLQVTLSIKPTTSTIVQTPAPNPTATSQNPGGLTEFVIQYKRNTASDVGNATQEASSATQTSDFNDLDKVPTQLRQYVEDLSALGVLTPDKAGSKSNSPAGVLFEPNKIISRRQYTQWLVAANNQIYSNSPSKQIRLTSTDTQPAFQDVPRTDSDFPVIQGLAEAGLIPSPLSGDTTAVLFRPDAPLTREDLILWKAPLDTRQALPSVSIDAVKQSWGFQDTARIDPKALRAVLADFQNGEQSNIRRVFGYTTLFQPKKPVTHIQAAVAIWYFGSQGEGVSAKDALQLKRQQSQSTPTPSSSPSPTSSTSPSP